MSSRRATCVAPSDLPGTGSTWSRDGGVADVATAFRRTDWTPTASGVPTNVAAICALTWMCSKTDIHANDAGYALMASTVNPLVVGPIRPATASVG